mmetsp:Transcript_13559/g.21427  ORF Transcript_13559/g.21427 Transcript_13559/m.21427 type:complete len:205 (+) Transcript_13559:2110-2724(+)
MKYMNPLFGIALGRRSAPKTFSNSIMYTPRHTTYVPMIPYIRPHLSSSPPHIRAENPRMMQYAADINAILCAHTKNWVGTLTVVSRAKKPDFRRLRRACFSPVFLEGAPLVSAIRTLFFSFPFIFNILIFDVLYSGRAGGPPLLTVILTSFWEYALPFDLRREVLLSLLNAPGLVSAENDVSNPEALTLRCADGDSLPSLITVQ